MSTTLVTQMDQCKVIQQLMDWLRNRLQGTDLEVRCDHVTSEAQTLGLYINGKLRGKGRTTQIKQVDIGVIDRKNKKLRLIVEVDPETDPTKPLGVFQSVFLADVYVPSLKHSPEDDYKIEDCVIIYATVSERLDPQFEAIEQAVRKKMPLARYGVRQIHLCHESTEEALVDKCKKLITDEVLTVSITSDAAARVEELGMRAELDEMLEHARQVVPELQHLDVVLEPSYDTGDEPHIVIEGWRGGTLEDDDQARGQWVKWEIETFPPDVLRHFTTLIFLGSPDAR